MNNENYAEFEGGARRSGKMPAYEAITYSFMRRLAETLADGKEKYPDHEDKLPNWMHGGREFAVDAFNHVVEHLYKWRHAEDFGAETDEDHLAHAAAGIMFLMHFEQNSVFSPLLDETDREQLAMADAWDSFGGDYEPSTSDLEDAVDISSPPPTKEDLLVEAAKAMSPIERARLFFGLKPHQEIN